MILVRIAAIALDTSGQHVMLLKPMAPHTDTSVVLPIWIGRLEATSILVALGTEPSPRPLIHKLTLDIVEQLGATLTSVTVTDILDGTFIAEVLFDDHGTERTVDARPSDAIALAARAGAPIYVAEHVLESSSIEDTFTNREDGEETESTALPDALTEQDLSEFEQFLENVDPEDFRE